MKGSSLRLRRLILAAMLAAAALILFIVEAQLPPLAPVPGIKLGLANVVTVFCLYTLGPWYALGVLLCRVVLGSLLAGQVSAVLYSLAGGLLAWGLSCALRPRLGRERVWVVSVLAAAAHNLGQLACAVWVTATPALFWYLPVLLLAAMPAGALTGLAAQLVLRRLGTRFLPH